MMEIESQVENPPSEDQTKLLFFDNFIYPQSQYNIEEIFFSKAIKLHQIRILKTDSNPHTKIKSNKSQTQQNPITNFEIFARNLNKNSDKFDKLFENDTVNKDNGETDSIFPFAETFITNHIVFRGIFEKLTLCIYGLPITGIEGHLLLEKSKTETSLEKLNEQSINNSKESHQENILSITNEEKQLVQNYPLDNLVSNFLKWEDIQHMNKKAYYINKPKINMTEKTKNGYIYYENDLFQHVQYLQSLYLSYNNNILNLKNNNKNVITLNELELIEHQKKFKNIFNIFSTIFSKDFCFLEDDCVFRKENLEIFNKIPDLTISIIINSLNGNLYGYSEIKYGLELLKFISNSKLLVTKFILCNGLESLYSLLIVKDHNNNNNNINTNIHSNSSNNNNLVINSTIIKSLALECIYRLISYKFAFERFMENIDKKKFPQLYILIKEYQSNNYSNNSNNNEMNILENQLLNNINNLNNNNINNFNSINNNFNNSIISICTLPVEKEKDKDKEKSSHNDKKKDKEKNSKDAKDKEHTREKESKDKDNKDSKDKDNKDSKDKDKKHSKKKHHSNHSKKSRSHSRSKSKSRSRSRSRDKKSKDKSKEKRSSSSNDSKKSNNNNSKKSKKKQHKNIPIKNGYQIINALLLNKRNHLIYNILKNIINKISLMLYLKNFNIAISETLSQNNERIFEIDYEKIYYDLIEIYKLLNRVQIPYKKYSNEDNQNILDMNYPYKYFWNDYVKTNRKFFKKSEEKYFNTKSTIENDCHSYTKLLSGGIITNEIAYILESYSFLNNLIIFLININNQISPQYFNCAMVIKNILSYIILSKGGINFLSKNFDITQNLFTAINNLTNKINSNNDPYLNENNFFSINLNYDLSLSNNKKFNEIYMNKSINENSYYSKVNEILIIPPSKYNYYFTDEYILQINYIQLKYILEYSFIYLNCLDDLVSLKEDEKNQEIINDDLSDKSLNIFLIICDNIKKSNLSKQAFFAFSQNNYFLNEILSLITNLTNKISTDNIYEIEGHISLLLEILSFIFTEINNNSDLLLLLYGSVTYDTLNNLHSSLNEAYDIKEIEPINKNLFTQIESILQLLYPTKLFDENQDIKSVLNHLNNSLYNNITKYGNNKNLDLSEFMPAKEYIEEIKLNIKNHKNRDIFYMDDFSTKNGLINDIFAALKLIRISIDINPLLLIDSTNEHIHLVIKYLIVNTVHSIKSFLSFSEINNTNNRNNNSSENKESQSKKIEIFEYIKEYTIVLSTTYRIFKNLLSNLLSSHVDHYRDTIVIEKTASLLICLINYLYEVYTLDNLQTLTTTDISIIEYLQMLFSYALSAFREICQFNTTIKLYLKNNLINHLIDNPNNKLGVIFLLNFIFNCTNNEYTMETFVDYLTKTQKNIQFDLLKEYENIKNIPIKFENFSENSTVLNYIIFIGINTNNDFIVNQSSNLLLTIYKSYIGTNKMDFLNETTSYILSKLDNEFNNISKLNYSIYKDNTNNNSDNDYKYLIPYFENLIRILKFLMVFIKSDYKFLFIFNEIDTLYLKIFSFFKNFILSFDYLNLENLNKNKNKIIQIVFDILFLILEALNVLCDSQRNSNQFIYENNNNTRYDLVEEMPNIEKLVKIVNEVYDFLNNFLVNNINKDSIEFENHNINFNKIIILSKKIFDIFICISSSYHGQNILLSKEYSEKYSNYNINRTFQILPVNNTPLIYLNSIIEKLGNIKNNDTMKSNKNIHQLIESISKLIVILFYDLNYYENSENIKTGNKINNQNNSNINQSNINNTNQNNTKYIYEKKVMILTESRLNSLRKLLLFDPSSSNTNNTNIDFMPEISQIINILLELIWYYTNDQRDLIFFELYKLKNVIDSYKQNMDILKIDVKINYLPMTRKIQDKCENLNKYYDYFQFQTYGINFPLEMDNNSQINLNNNSLLLTHINSYSSNSSLLSSFSNNSNDNNNDNQISNQNNSSNLLNNNSNTNSNINSTINNLYNKGQIHEFAKLLNWKKHRIFLSKENSLNVRRCNFDLDLCINPLNKKYMFDEFDYYKLKKKYYYYSNDPFEQYCNFVFNQNLKLNTFTNISFLITSSVINKLYLLANDEDYTQEIHNLFLKELDYSQINLNNILMFEKEESNNSNLIVNQNQFKIKKKINSKLNEFIYKLKYEKHILNNNNNMSNKNNININPNPINKERCLSKVSGRNLSTHVDNVVPGAKVVNLTYAGGINPVNIPTNNNSINVANNNEKKDNNNNVNANNNKNKIQNNPIINNNGITLPQVNNPIINNNGIALPQVNNNISNTQQNKDKDNNNAPIINNNNPININNTNNNIVNSNENIIINPNLKIINNNPYYQKNSNLNTINNNLVNENISNVNMKDNNNNSNNNKIIENNNNVLNENTNNRMEIEASLNPINIPTTSINNTSTNLNSIEEHTNTPNLKDNTINNNNLMNNQNLNMNQNKQKTLINNPNPQQPQNILNPNTQINLQQNITQTLLPPQPQAPQNPQNNLLKLGQYPFGLNPYGGNQFLPGQMSLLYPNIRQQPPPIFPGQYPNYQPLMPLPLITPLNPQNNNTNNNIINQPTNNNNFNSNNNNNKNIQLFGSLQNILNKMNSSSSTPHNEGSKDPRLNKKKK